MLLGFVILIDTPVSTRVDTDTGVGSVFDSSDMVGLAKNGRKMEEKMEKDTINKLGLFFTE